MTKPIEPVIQSSFFTVFTIPAAPSFKAIGNRFSSIKLPSSAQKVVLAALTLFALYAIYRAFQSLKDRVEKLEEDLATANQKIKNLTKRIDPYCPIKDSPSLESFKQQIPGGHLTCRVKSGEIMALSNYFLQTLFRMDENPTCVDEGEGRFTLTYDEAKTFKFTKLLEKTSRVKKISLRSIAPEFQISRVIKVQIIKKEGATDLIFDPTALFLLRSRLRSTGHLKILTIFGQAHPDPKKGHFLALKVEHDIQLIIGKKDKTFDHQEFVDLLELNINQSSH